MLKLYYQLTKPGIIAANVLSAAAGFLLAEHHPQLSKLLALIAGISLIIAAACIFNNYLDRGIDAKMARTKQRALVSGQIPVKRAIIFGGILGIIGFMVLIVWVNWLTVLIGAVAFVDYVVLYGIAKRRSEHGTLVGTLAGSASIVAGYTAAVDHLNLAALILWLALTFWQMAHFYAISIYRLDDYKAAGLPVWPLKRGISSTKRLLVGYSVAFVIASFCLTVFRYTGYIYLGIMGLVSFYWLVVVVDGLQTSKNQVWARQVFLRSLIVIVVFSMSLMFGARVP